MTGGDWGSVVSAGFAGVSALIAARTIYVQQRSQASREILEQAVRSLSWAWEALTDSGEHVSPPRPNRLNWLTAARHIVRYQALKVAIKDKSHRLICEEQEEFWRHRFYDSLAGRELLQPGYFNAASHQEGGIDKTSAVVVHAFGKWAPDKEDPIECVDVERLIRDLKLLDGRPGLRTYLGRDATGG